MKAATQEAPAAPAIEVVEPPHNRRALAPVAPAQPPAEQTPASIVALAVSRNAPLSEIREFMVLQREWEADQARKAFNAAFAAFKGEAVRVIKSTQITDGPLKGKKHANLFDVVVASTEKLAKHGLSTSWKLTKDEPTWMEVTCTLKHAAGHAETVSMGAAPDAGPGRNAIQARGSAITYLERYTLTAILGLAAADADDDGSGGPGQVERVSREQAATLQALADEVKANIPGFLKYVRSRAKVECKSLEDIPANFYADAVAALQAKRSTKEGAK